jgi:selenocysteine-specific elongation factor
VRQEERGGAVFEVVGMLYGSRVRAEAETLVLEAVDRGHAVDSLRAGVPRAEIRAALPRWAASQLADAVLERLIEAGVLEAVEGEVRRPGHSPELSGDQAEASERLLALLRDGGLAPPFVDELPEELRRRGDLRSLLRRLEESEVVRQVADGYFVLHTELEAAATRVSEQLAGRSALGPADFREALPVSRKWLIPLLNHLDGQGITIRRDGGRDVPPCG